MQHFTIEELKQIKATVLQQHFKLESVEVPEKFVTENKSGKSDLNIYAVCNQLGGGDYLLRCARYWTKHII